MMGEPAATGRCSDGEGDIQGIHWTIKKGNTSISMVTLGAIQDGILGLTV